MIQRRPQIHYKPIICGGPGMGLATGSWTPVLNPQRGANRKFENRIHTRVTLEGFGWINELSGSLSACRRVQSFTIRTPSSLPLSSLSLHFSFTERVFQVAHFHPCEQDVCVNVSLLLTVCTCHLSHRCRQRRAHTQTRARSQRADHSSLMSEQPKWASSLEAKAMSAPVRGDTHCNHRS